MIIAICGMDGSGKTTLAQKLLSQLRKKGLPAEFFHGHTYAVSSDSGGLKPAQVKKLSGLFRFLLPLAYCDNIFTYFFRYRPRARRRILILDRYFYDKVARMLYFGICGKTLAKLYARSLPRPELVFFLDAPEDVVYARKKEYEYDKLQIFRRAYLCLAPVINARVIDTTAPVEETAAAIFEDIRAYDRK